MTGDAYGWLRDRWTEHRALAEAASPGPWRPGGYSNYGFCVIGPSGESEFGDLPEGPADVAHVAANDPPFVIAVCGMALTILAEHQMADFARPRIGLTRGCAACHGATCPCPTAKALAAPFLGRDDVPEVLR